MKGWEEEEDMPGRGLSVSLEVEMRSSTVLKNWNKASLTVLQRTKGRLVNNKAGEEAGPRSCWVL